MSLISATVQESVTNYQNQARREASKVHGKRLTKARVMRKTQLRNQGKTGAEVKKAAAAVTVPDVTPEMSSIALAMKAALKR